MNAPKCNTCLHFIQHYVRAGRSYRKSYYGHCVYPRLKRREIDSASCKYYSVPHEVLSKNGRAVFVIFFRLKITYSLHRQKNILIIHKLSTAIHALLHARIVYHKPQRRS